MFYLSNILKVSKLLLCISLYASASNLIGVGGFDVKRYGNHYAFRDANLSHTSVNITEVLDKYSPNVNSISMWITKEWKEEWYPTNVVQKEIIDKGYIPVFIFYWFADKVSIKYIQENRKKYFQTLKHFTAYMKQLKGQKIVVLNPEYNMFGTEKWKGMNEVFLQSFSILREDPQVILGPCVGDFGDYGKVNEPEEWKLFNPSLSKAVKKADFVAFQEMRALTRNSKKEIISTPIRAYNFSKYLYETYHKPTLLAYMAISTYGKNGKEIQANIYRQLIDIVPKMQKEAGLLYFGNFHYFDYLGHTGYFNAAEEYFGLVDANGTAKPSLEYFNKLH